MSDLLFSMACDETYFFRGGTPFTVGEDSFLPSVFPPNPSVMQGVVRTAIMRGHGIDFAEYREGRCSVCRCAASECTVLSAVGSAGTHDDMRLDVTGPFLTYEEPGGPKERLFKAPVDLVSMGDDIGKLRPYDTPIHTDMGPVCLPQSAERCKPLEHSWLGEAGLLKYLKGQSPSLHQVHSEKAFLGKETRIGIARERSTRATHKGMLYSIEHVRLKQGYGLGARVANCPDVKLPAIVKLGGEGRLSRLAVSPWEEIPSHGIAPAINSCPGLFGQHGFKLVFLSPVRFEGESWLPEGFVAREREGVRIWEGSIRGIECSFVSMCADRPVRLGGWNMATGRQKPRHSYIPAGSVFYFITERAGEDVVNALFDVKLGLDTAIGLGHAVVGRW
ncbi:MAG: type III-B CRISPR module-associated protein Cmr3 [Firmicutes bacterium]|nr:type III-B CRISPR module-associated protein Cmr3 [Bacillota bacterium]